jgi:GPH family glycoside/pentoside/hexuronide:cation symporter
MIAAIKNMQDRFVPLYFGWAVGTLGNSLLLNAQNVMILFFMVTVLKIEPVVAGTIITASKIYDLATDPFMGAISDRTRSRWGRRRPYLFGGGILCGISFAMLFAVPAFQSDVLMYTWVIASLFLVATAYTIFNVPYLCMPAEMVDGYHDRSVLMSYRVFFISVGTYLAVSGAPALIGLLQDVMEYSPRAAYGYVGVIIGSLILIAMVGAFFGTKNAGYTERTRVELSLSEKVALFVGNKPFILFMGIKLLGLFALASILASKFFFVRYIMEQSIAIAAILGTTQFIGQLSGLPAWLRLSKAVGKKRMLVFSSIAMAAVTLTWLFSGPDESLYVYGLRGLFLGLAGGGTILGVQAILPDIMEYDYRRTGLRREGLYAGLASFIEKSAFALAAFAIGAFLSGMNFDRNLPEGAAQPDSALWAIMICTALLPTGAYLLKLILLAFFDLSEDKLKSTERVTA